MNDIKGALRLIFTEKYFLNTTNLLQLLTLYSNILKTQKIHQTSYNIDLQNNWAVLGLLETVTR